MDLLIPKDELVELFMGYLETKHCSGWGQQYSVFEEAGRKNAAEWFVEQLFGMIEYEERERTRNGKH